MGAAGSAIAGGGELVVGYICCGALIDACGYRAAVGDQEPVGEGEAVRRFPLANSARLI